MANPEKRKGVRGREGRFDETDLPAHARQLTSSGSERRGILVNLLRKREVPRPRRITATMHRVRDADIARVCKSIRALAGGEEHSESKNGKNSRNSAGSIFFNDSKMGVKLK